ncbi:RloB family protein [Succinimonas sp.]|uniref:RloB family protein n=1 Tax=Succinimonas sp. TaxID=1936151 RepID=UPI00386EFE0A
MIKCKSTLKYYFSVEGETEQWYLEWLQNQINNAPEAASKVSFNKQIQKDPLRRAKSLAITDKVEIWHLSDYESSEEVHVKQFKETMDRMAATKSLKKQITYRFGYSNFTFDLWIILHKMDCRGSFLHRKQYITPINNAYNENFENMEDFKREANFKRCLKKLTLRDVIEAVKRAKAIMEINKQNGYTLHQYRGYSYYKENPSLMIWEIIEKILKDCQLM